MYNVCAKHCGSEILLESFNTKEAAEEFMRYDYLLFYADELEGAAEDEIVRAEEMYLEDDIPFYEPIKEMAGMNDELPY